MARLLLPGGVAILCAGCVANSDNGQVNAARSCDASWVVEKPTPLGHELRLPEPGGYLDSPATNAFINQIADPLRRAYGFRPGEPHVYIVPDAAIDAHAMIENNIFVSYGLLREAHSSDVVAGILAHEMGHVACHHALHNSMWDVADWALHAGFIAVAVGGASWTANLAQNAQAFVVLGGLGGTAQTQISEWAYSHAGWSRGQETKADLIGTEMLIRAHKPTSGLVVALGEHPEAVADVSAGKATGTAFSGPDHPAESTRVNDIGNFLAKAHPGWHDPLPDNAAYTDWESATSRLSIGLAYMLQAQDAVAKPLALFGHPEVLTNPRRAQIALEAVRKAFSIPRWTPNQELPPQADPEMAALAKLTLTRWVVDEVRLRLAPESLDQAEARKEILALPDLPQHLILLDDAILLHDERWKDALVEILEIGIRAGDQRVLYPFEMAANSGGKSDQKLSGLIGDYTATKCILTADLDVMKQCSEVEKNPMPTINGWWQAAIQEPDMVAMPIHVAQPPRHTLHRRALKPAT